MKKYKDVSLKKLLSFFAVCSFLFVSLLMFGTSTSSCYKDCYERQWGYVSGAFDEYDVHADLVTPAGTPYDASGLDISPELIDRLTSETEACLVKNDVMKGTIDRASFIVKVADDWVLNCDKTQQLLPIESGSKGCLEKGLTPTDDCPCRWRAGMQCPNVLIVPPNFYLFKDVLIRFVTGDSNPWDSADTAECASPSTTPLSDGSDPQNGL